MSFENVKHSLTCGFGSSLKTKIKPPDHERIVLHKVKLNTFYSGTCEVYLEKNIFNIKDCRSNQNSPRSPTLRHEGRQESFGHSLKEKPAVLKENSFRFHSDAVELRSYNNGTTIKVIDVQENNIDYNMVYPFSSLKVLNLKKVDLDGIYFENDIIVNCYEYIDFLKSYDIKFPYSDLYVLCNVPDLENAYWNGSYLTFGDGVEGRSYALVSPAIVGHELFHAVIQSSINLDYYGESGALNESYSDIFGVMFEFWLQEKRKGIGYELGSELFVDGHSMRSFVDPNKCGQPKSTRDPLFYRGTEDNGGVHFNSSLPNHCFYKMQLVTNRKEVFDIFIKVFFRLRHNSDFNDFKRILLSYCLSNIEYVNIINEIFN